MGQYLQKRVGGGQGSRKYSEGEEVNKGYSKREGLKHRGRGRSDWESDVPP